jgi:hypothetical protein
MSVSEILFICNRNIDMAVTWTLTFTWTMDMDKTDTDRDTEDTDRDTDRDTDMDRGIDRDRERDKERDTNRDVIRDATVPESSINSWVSWFIFNLRKNKHLLLIQSQLVHGKGTTIVGHKKVHW